MKKFILTLNFVPQITFGMNNEIKFEKEKISNILNINSTIDENKINENININNIFETNNKGEKNNSDQIKSILEKNK